MRARRCGVCGGELKTRASDRKPASKPRLTRKLMFLTEPTEGVIRVFCRTKVVRITPKELGYHITEFLYRPRMLPADSPTDPRELEEA